MISRRVRDFPVPALPVKKILLFFTSTRSTTLLCCSDKGGGTSGADGIALGTGATQPESGTGIEF